MDVNLVEDDLAEVDISNPDLGLESGIEKINAGGDDCGSDVKPNWHAECSLDPKTGHEENDYIGGER